MYKIEKDVFSRFEIKISYLLWKYDPIGTCCTVNTGMEDEYDIEAMLISKLLNHGIPFKYAYIATMTSMFWDDIVIKSFPVLRYLMEEYYSMKLNREIFQPFTPVKRKDKYINYLNSVGYYMVA